MKNWDKAPYNEWKGFDITLHHYENVKQMML